MGCSPKCPVIPWSMARQYIFNCFVLCLLVYDISESYIFLRQYAKKDGR